MKILYNARLYTLDSSNTRASAMVIARDRILAIGESEEIRSCYGGGFKDIHSIDLQGRTILPGLVDAHMHLVQYALSLQKIDCETPTKAACLQRVVEQVQSFPPGVWILGHGWNQNSWPEGWGTRADLDQVAPGHPVYLTAKSLHAGWANSAALNLAGVNASTPDPHGGRIGRDALGNPDGILFESAMDLVSTVVPAPTQSTITQAVEQAQGVLWRLGLTGIHDFDRRSCFVALQELHQESRLNLRVTKSIPLEDLPQAAALGLRTGFGDDYLRIGSIKAFADGALGPRTAAMLQAYETEPANRGMLLLDSEELYEHGRMAVDSGLSLAVHAIGDLANHHVLNTFGHLREYESMQATQGHTIPPTLLRHRIEHVQLIHPDDANRLGELGIIASMQPIHATSDMFMADRFWGKRAALSYAWRAQQQAGAILAFGSDAPVESPNPFWGVYAAVTRRRADGTPGPDGWYPEQRLSLKEALSGFTGGAAFAAGMEDRLGKLAKDYLADLIVLDTDLIHCDVEQIRDLKPVGTMIGGEWVFKEFD